MKTHQDTNIARTLAALAVTEQASFGVGGSCSPRMAPGEGYGSSCPPAPVVPGCARPGRVCDVATMSSTQAVTGGTAFTMLIEPEGVPFFDTQGVRCTVTDLANTDLSHRVLFTAVRVGLEGREAYDDTNPLANLPAANGNTIQGQWSDDWSDPDGYAIPKGWGRSSNEAMSQPLRITGIAIGVPASVLLLVSITCVGNALAQ